MNIAITGRGNAGRGPAALRRKAGHEVTTPGRRGGAGGAGVLVVAVPGPAIWTALGTVTGLAGKIAIDAADAFPCRNEAFASLTEAVNSVTGAPVAKSFNLNRSGRAVNLKERQETMTTSNVIAGRDLETLRTAVAGDVFAPGDHGYDQARRAWNLTTETPAGASAVLSRDSYHRLQKIKATYDPDQAIITTHPVRRARH